MIAAHTHNPESNRHCIGQRLLREIVVGSVIDPPQEASLIEIGLDTRDRAALRLTALPLVARAGLACSNEHTIDAGSCRQTLATLTLSPDCQDLLAPAGTAATCETLERDLTFGEKIDRIVHFGGPRDTDTIKAEDARRARALVRCVCRQEGTSEASASCPGVWPAPLEKEAYASLIEELSRDPQRQRELACLSWAASAVQQHKSNGMRMSDAIRCAFDDPKIAPEHITVADTEDVACR